MSEDDRPGRRRWVWFRLRNDPDKPALGVYLGERRVRLLRCNANKRIQGALLLDAVTHWAPFSEDVDRVA